MTRAHRNAQFEAEEQRGAEATDDAIRLTERKRIMEEHNVSAPIADHVADAIAKVNERKLDRLAELRQKRYETALAEYAEDTNEADYGPDPDEYYEYLRDTHDDV
jgi:hypothetical protein